MAKKKIAINWHTEKRKLASLIPSKYNPRQANEKEYSDLAISLERFNLADPIIINTNSHVIGGHFRIKILREKTKNNGNFMVDVRVPSRQLTAHEEKELNLRLNKNLGRFNFDMLANFDEQLLKEVGFRDSELESIFQLETDASGGGSGGSAEKIECPKCGHRWKPGK